MQDKPEPGSSKEIRVRVFGMGADGKPFFQNADAHNIATEGAVLSGLERELAPGEIIGVQYHDKKARFRVVWVIDAGELQKIQAGIEVLAGQLCPWKEEAGASISIPAASNQKATAANKRKFTRHKISFPLELRADRGSSAPMQTSATDISGRGCYIETIMPLPMGTNLKVIFWIEHEKITTAGVVRACDPGVGMGIEFSGLSLEDQDRLQQTLDKKSDEVAAQTAAKSDG